MEKITAELRVTTLKVQPFSYRDGKGEMVGGESLEMRAAGFWIDDIQNHYPVSLHATVYPGHGVVPAIGDCVRVTVERLDDASQREYGERMEKEKVSVERSN
jgi:hypothetical protein